MSCPQTDWPGQDQFLPRLARQAIRQGVPLAGSLDLTHRCNLRCLHCYLGPGKAHPAGAGEMDTAQVLQIVEQAAAAGCLYLLITGGEPLLRPDFSVIYRHARESGLIVTVFSNGTLITDEVVALFHELPPWLVEISLYGASRATYESVTQVAGSYERCRAGIDRLVNAGVRTSLKTVLMTVNQHEYSKMEGLARRLGVRFRFDAAICAALDGDQAPLALRVDACQAIALEMSDPARRQRWRDYAARCGNLPPGDGRYQCGAGLSNFYVDPQGWLRACLMVPEPSYELRNGCLADGWQERIRPIRQQRATPSSRCHSCAWRIFCGYCPGFLALEHAGQEEPAAYLCRLGELRYQALHEPLSSS